MRFNIPKTIPLLLAMCGLTPLMSPTRLSNEIGDGILSQCQLPTSKCSRIPTSWKNLIPLQTTREQVERVLGKPKSSKGSRQIYENDTERVDVVYSPEKCEPVAGRWNVESFVVITVDVYPKKSILLKDLILEKEKYARQKWLHPNDWVTYRNVEDGIEIDTVDGKNTEEVRRFSFGPKAKDDKLRCKQ